MLETTDVAEATQLKCQVGNQCIELEGCAGEEVTAWAIDGNIWKCGSKKEKSETHMFHY